MYMNTSKQGSWQTVKSSKDEKKKKHDEKKKQEAVQKDRLGVAIDPTKAAFAAFDRAFAEQPKQQEEKAGYKGAFAGDLAGIILYQLERLCRFPCSP